MVSSFLSSNFYQSTSLKFVFKILWMNNDSFFYTTQIRKKNEMNLFPICYHCYILSDMRYYSSHVSLEANFYLVFNWFTSVKGLRSLAKYISSVSKKFQCQSSVKINKFFIFLKGYIKERSDLYKKLVHCLVISLLVVENFITKE